MAKFPEWNEQWKSQYDEDNDCEVLKADISVMLKKPNGDIVIRRSEYKAKDVPEIRLAEKKHLSPVICG